MKVTLPIRQWSRWGMLIIAVLGSSAALAEEHQAMLESALACADETSRLERLSCYDDVFKTATVSTQDRELPDLWYAIDRQESERDSDDLSLLVGHTGDDVLMSVPALGTTPPRPIMVMACEKQITRFQLHMPEPIDNARVDLQLHANGTTIRQQWRVRDGGHVINGGRGLPAIETLRQLLSANNVTINSDLASLDGLRFDITDLRQLIQPLREACRW
ncbi:type VI secretion system-associated protein VasI [Halomonas alkaliantarctica]|uniref:Type VI secretion system-associated protein VasI n=1 Tax=Halomonas alkaliantarctica TaxID=232346 RepID=A0ABY8LMQ1_9GAMM|nr:type VI secretion system-associated protein VasI [Halomonas alkaliantarctica]WGI24859.1 type VI secretion system-associated protein VasI [Halomonas alkaliantarctica]